MSRIIGAIQRPRQSRGWRGPQGWHDQTWVHYPPVAPRLRLGRNLRPRIESRQEGVQMFGWSTPKIAGCIAAVALGVCVLAIPAGASASSPSLGGEVYFNQHVPAHITSGTCNPDGSSSYTFEQSGTDITGPYPGNFTETGSVTIGPMNIA